VNGVWEIKAHPFFAGIKWKSIRKMSSPYTPDVCLQVLYYLDLRFGLQLIRGILISLKIRYLGLILLIANKRKGEDVEEFLIHFSSL
jgi:hypothetical protein